MRKLRFSEVRVTISHLGAQVRASDHLTHLQLRWETTESPGALVPLHPSWPAPPSQPYPTYDVHECEQVLLHVLLPVELNHGVVHTQQDLNVVVVVGSVPAHPAPRAVDPLLQDAQGTAEVIQAAAGDPWKVRGHSLKQQPSSPGVSQQHRTPLGCSSAPARGQLGHHLIENSQLPN